MNDREISDFDKLKNLLIEFGIEYQIQNFYSTLKAIEFGSGYFSCEFRFTDEGKFFDFSIDD